MTNPPPVPPHQQGQPYVAPPGRFDDNVEKKSWVPGCLIGCLITLGICGVLCAGVGYYAYSNASKFAIQTARAGVEAMLQESDLPQEERDAIMVQFERVATAYENGDITLEETGQLMQDLLESPLMSIVILDQIEMRYLDSSGLSEEEQEEAKQTLARIVRGAQEKKLDQKELEELSRHVLVDPDEDAGPNQQRELKTTMTDEELRTFFAEAKQLADEKEIPEDVVPDKISEVIRGVVDEALQKP